MEGGKGVERRGGGREGQGKSRAVGPARRQILTTQHRDVERLP